MSGIVSISAKEFGLEESKASEVEQAFIPMLNKMTELESEYNEIVSQDITKELCDKAKELRQKYVKVRTGTAKIHKELKAFYLAGGRFVDGWKNAQLFASQGIEDKLAAIENHFINIEKERIQGIEDSRKAILAKYEVEVLPEHLGHIEESLWEKYLDGVKLSHAQMLEAKAKEAKELDEKENADRLAREALERENAVLRAKEAEEREARIALQKKADEQERAEQEQKRNEEIAKKKLLESSDAVKLEAYLSKLLAVTAPEIQSDAECVSVYQTLIGLIRRAHVKAVSLNGGK